MIDPYWHLLQGFFAWAAGYDVIAHFLVGAWIYCTLRLFSVPGPIAALAVLCAALGKEIFIDPNTELLEPAKDITVSMLGVAVSSVLWTGEHK